MSGDEAHVENGDTAPTEISGWADAMSRILGSNKPKKKKMLILSRAKKDYEVKRSEQVAEKVAEKGNEKRPEKKPAPKPQYGKNKKMRVRVVDTSLEIVKSNPNEEEEASEPKPEPEEIPVPEVAPVPESKKKSAKKAVALNEDDIISLKSERKLELKRRRLQKEMENLNRTKPDSAKDKEYEKELRKVATKGVVELFNAVNLQKQALGKRLKEAPKSQFRRDKIISQTKDLFEDALEKVATKSKQEK